MLNDELTRVRQVAARATVREIGGGAKDEGVVPVKMHLEEVPPPPIPPPCRCPPLNTTISASRPYKFALKRWYSMSKS